MKVIILLYFMLIAVICLLGHDYKLAYVQVLFDEGFSVQDKGFYVSDLYLNRHRVDNEINGLSSESERYIRRIANKVKRDYDWFLKKEQPSYGRYLLGAGITKNSSRRAAIEFGKVFTDSKRVRNFSLLTFDSDDYFCAKRKKLLEIGLTKMDPPFELLEDFEASVFRSNIANNLTMEHFMEIMKVLKFEQWEFNKKPRPKLRRQEQYYTTLFYLGLGYLQEDFQITDEIKLSTEIQNSRKHGLFFHSQQMKLLINCITKGWCDTVENRQMNVFAMKYESMYTILHYYGLGNQTKCCFGGDPTVALVFELYKTLADKAVFKLFFYRSLNDVETRTDISRDLCGTEYCGLKSLLYDGPLFDCGLKTDPTDLPATPKAAITLVLPTKIPSDSVTDPTRNPITATFATVEPPKFVKLRMPKVVNETQSEGSKTVRGNQLVYETKKHEAEKPQSIDEKYIAYFLMLLGSMLLCCCYVCDAWLINRNEKRQQKTIVFDPRKIDRVITFIKALVTTKNIDDMCEEYKSFGSHNGKVAASTAHSKENRSPYHCFDRNRVELTAAGVPHDYINANYIDFFDKENKFICTQAPIQTMKYSFYAMILEQKCEIIVNLEVFKQEEMYYWPEMLDEEYTFQSGGHTIKVTNRGTDVWINGRTSVYMTVLEVKLDDKSPHMVTHYQWPDWKEGYGPEGRTGVIPFLDMIMMSDHPIVLHCMNGVGKSGTFLGIALLHEGIQSGDVVLEEAKDIEKGEKSSIQQVFVKLRSQRDGAIETENQYLCIYRIIIDHYRPILEQRNTFKNKAVFNDWMEKLDAKLQNKVLIV